MPLNKYDIYWSMGTKKIFNNTFHLYDNKEIVTTINEKNLLLKGNIISNFNKIDKIRWDIEGKIIIIALESGIIL